MRILFLFLFGLISCYNTLAKTRSGECPPWVNGDLPPRGNDSYYFMRSDGAGSTLNESFKDADLMLVSSLMRAAGVTVSGSQIEKVLYQNHNNNLNENISSEYQYEFELNSVHLAFKSVDNYWEKTKNGYECKVLYEVAYSPIAYNFEPVEYTSKYGLRGFWRSALIPGWGQMYKRSYAKGITILVLEATAVTSAIIFDNRYSSYIRKSHSTSDSNAIKFYQNKANNAKNIRNGLFIGASAVYIYNLVDVMATKGKLRYLKSKTHTMAFAPFIDYDCSLGLSVAYTF